MGAVAKTAKLFGLLLLLLVPCSVSAQTSPSSASPPRHSLFAQSAVQILEREFTHAGESYLFLDAQSGSLLASNWENYEKPIPLGSLVKPFTALAYAAAHDYRYPTFECRGKSSGCWQVQPHGKLDIVVALSVSCNAYFRRLAESITATQLLLVTQSLGVEAPDAEINGAGLIGIGERWRIAPLHMAHAYLELYRRREQPGVWELLEGMKQSAQRGTGSGVGHALTPMEALVKTGTAPCTHAPWAPADGFVITLVPAERPEILLMVRVHGVAGAKAAETTGRMLRRMEN
jgi:cell division protein FtsI/penicillin-binding protein 2